MVQDVNKRNESYNEYVKTVTKKADCLLNCLKAFIMGGCICTLGQLVTNLLMTGGLSMDDASSYTTIILVFLSALFTGLGIYQSWQTGEGQEVLYLLQALLTVWHRCY